jgi:uncharacterized protein (TIGR02147 family)
MLSVYNYKDPIDYISSVLNHLKALDPDFSIKYFSYQIGLNSSAPLIDVLKRKKSLKDKMAARIADHIKIDHSERMYYNALVSKSQITNLEKEKMYDLLMNDLSPTSCDEFTSFRSDKLDIFSHWIYMAILSLSELPSFKLSVENIKEKLIEDIDATKIDKAMLELFSYGLLVTDEKGLIKKSHLRTATRSDIKHDGVHVYYALVCDLAKKAISTPLELREFNTFSFPINSKDIPLAKEIMRKCRNNLSKLSESSECDKIYQANLLLFPLTN